ncbi:MAG: DUF2442 domain-containing protein [Opitutus sp.]|nr:DUF2442 domain-containing protein [Opitutus sp.]
MNTLADTTRRAFHRDGHIVVVMESGVEIRFPVAKNPRLARGTPAQLDHIELSPLGLHWPDLDEDLSLRGLVDGNFGQHQKSPR